MWMNHSWIVIQNIYRKDMVIMFNLLVGTTPFCMTIRNQATLRKEGYRGKTRKVWWRRWRCLSSTLWPSFFHGLHTLLWPLGRVMIIMGIVNKKLKSALIWHLNWYNEPPIWVLSHSCEKSVLVSHLYFCLRSAYLCVI